MVKVSAIVPVFNPGADIDDCIRTLLDQSLPRDEYEVIFVDDGSTDATPERLDEVAAEHPNVRVEHIPNSGWPGRPRNIGIAMARGEYVYFVDNDDWLGREALERLYERARSDRADVVVGKVVGHGQTVPNGIFRRNRCGVGLEWTPLLWLLTPHKLFRKALLDEHGIRYPEGRRRLEDHVFVMHAYFHAERISILADYPCYHWVFRGKAVNASSDRYDPAGYYDNLREVLDLVDEHTEPGELRDRLYSHWYRGKLLGRVGGKALTTFHRAYARERTEEIRRLVLERFPNRLDALLPFHLRVRAALLRAGDWHALRALAEWEADLRADLRLREERREGEDLVLDIDATVVAPDGPLRYERIGRRLLWVPPTTMPDLDADARDATDHLQRGGVYTVVRSTADGSEFALPVRLQRHVVPISGDGEGPMRPHIQVSARLSPATAAAGRPLPSGEWEVLATPSITGFKHTGAVRRYPGAPPHRVEVTPDRRLVERRAGVRARIAGVALEWVQRHPGLTRTRTVRALRRLVPYAQRAHRRLTTEWR